MVRELLSNVGVSLSTDDFFVNVETDDDQGKIYYYCYSMFLNFHSFAKENMNLISKILLKLMIGIRKERNHQLMMDVLQF